MISVASFVDHLKGLADYRNQVAHIEHLPSREASYRKLGTPLALSLEMALQQAGLSPLYSHQAVAIDATRSGKNVIVVTPAASGKTLCYNVPVLQAILTEKGSRALYLFPTKALAQDQLRSLTELVSLLPTRIRLATFDGDTPTEERPQIRRTAQIVLTNPDMLHLGILPNHPAWSRFFRRLKYVVVDEAHIYRGVFGSHVGNVLRRLRRIFSLYNVSPQFICCSATIGNPREHIEKLVGQPFEVIEADGAPRGKKDFILWNPPILDPAKTSRHSANAEAAFLLAELVRQGIRTLAFAKTRKLTELIYNYARQRLAESNLAQQIKPYRAGYLPEDRRQIEQELFQGQLLGVVATTALELGIDIGDLDATVLTGYPGSIAATWQQAGRSGRRTGQSLSFLIGLDNPLDQYFMRHPESIFRRNFENALTDPGNPYVLKSHLLCAAWELPLAEGDEKLWGTSFAKARDALQEEGLLREQRGNWYLAATIAYPAEHVNIRSTSSLYYIILDSSQGNIPLETVESSVAFSQIHPGAIYLHQGRSYLITKLDLLARTAYATPTDVPYYTQAKELTDLRVLRIAKEKDTPKARSYLGEVEVTTAVIGFRRKRQFTEEVVDEEPLDLPPQCFQTVALWLDIPAQAVDRIAERQLDFAGGLHAGEHAAIAILPLFALCDRNDLGGVSTPFHPDTGKAQIFIYDAHPGGTGIAEKGFDLIQDLWRETLKVIAECPCDGGCPSCIQSPKCGNNNQPLDKKAAQIILKELTEDYRKGEGV
ncbi:MAG: DEAD/DEAH box helicase [Chloroflexi bacterium]|nr:DEAD/DEAH box helicase [Chloroflexota bacterium]